TRVVYESLPCARMSAVNDGENVKQSTRHARSVTLDIRSFEEIQDEFLARVSRIVWCNVSTVDRKGRPRSRILHPIWEGSAGWIATGRNSFKATHMAGNRYVSLR